MYNIVIGEWAPIYMFGEKTKYVIHRNSAIIKNTITGKELTHTIDKDGYHRIKLSHNGKEKIFIVSRLVYISFYGDYEFTDEINQINHKDGNKDNNSLSNLEVCTCAQNIQHAIDNNLRNTQGINSSLNKYPEEIIYSILKLLEEGYNIKYISKKLNIPRTNISDIKRGRTWTHISKDYSLPDCVHRKDIDTIKQIIFYILDGKGNKEISKLCGVGHKYVSLIRCKKRHKKIFDEIEQIYTNTGSTTIENEKKDLYDIKLTFHE